MQNNSIVLISEYAIILMIHFLISNPTQEDIDSRSFSLKMDTETTTVTRSKMVKFLAARGIILDCIQHSAEEEWVTVAPKKRM